MCTFAGIHALTSVFTPALHVQTCTPARTHETACRAVSKLKQDSLFTVQKMTYVQQLRVSTNMDGPANRQIGLNSRSSTHICTHVLIKDTGEIAHPTNGEEQQKTNRCFSGRPGSRRRSERRTHIYISTQDAQMPTVMCILTLWGTCVPHTCANTPRSLLFSALRVGTEMPTLAVWPGVSWRLLWLPETLLHSFFKLRKFDFNQLWNARCNACASRGTPTR